MSNSLYQQLRAVRKEAQQKGNFNPETWTYSDPFCAKVEEVITDALVALVELQERNDDLVRQNQLEPSNNLKVYSSKGDSMSSKSCDGVWSEHDRFHNPTANPATPAENPSKELDSLRRLVCEYEATYKHQYYFSKEEVAERRGWDCFKNLPIPDPCIITTLRSPARLEPHICNEAANEIERLRNERDEVRRRFCELGAFDDKEARATALRQGWDCYKENTNAR